MWFAQVDKAETKSPLSISSTVLPHTISPIYDSKSDKFRSFQHHVLLQGLRYDRIDMLHKVNENENRDGKKMSFIAKLLTFLSVYVGYFV